MQRNLGKEIILIANFKMIWLRLGIFVKGLVILALILRINIYIKGFRRIFCRLNLNFRVFNKARPESFNMILILNRKKAKTITTTNKITKITITTIINSTDKYPTKHPKKSVQHQVTPKTSPSSPSPKNPQTHISTHTKTTNNW